MSDLPTKAEYDELKEKLDNLLSRNDGWQNLAAGLSVVGRDKTRATTYVTGCNILTDTALNSLYTGDGFGAAIVDIPADDMTREWITIENDDGRIMNELKRIHAESRFNQALKWARLYGGSGIVLGVSNNPVMEKPLIVGKGRKVMWLEIIARPQIYIMSSTINDDLTSDNYGKVDLYNIQIGLLKPKMINVHFTKFLEFKGKPVPYDSTIVDQERLYWGMSAIQQPWEYLQYFGSAVQAIANILLEFVVGKYTLAGLRDMLAQGQEEKVVKRMEMINYIKSICNAVLLDETENYSRDSATVAGLSDLLDRFQMNLSGVCRIPVTKLFRRSPAGMNATGESDLTNYYDDIASEQENILAEPLQKLVNITAVSLGMASSVDTADFPITFNPLYQMTEKEKAETEKMKADTYNIYMQGGVLDPMEVREIAFPELPGVAETGSGKEEE